MGNRLVQIGQGDESGQSRERRPEWLRIRLSTPESYHGVRKLVDGLALNTVCEEARCPNIYECWGEHGTATFMILGDICTRRCGFCSVTSGRPNPGVDPEEPKRVAEAVQTMGLSHAVITSVDRDDLPDGGAGHFADVTREIHGRCPGTAVELLTPDFRGVPEALDLVLIERPEVFSHNMETVPRLYREARPASRWDRSLGLLAEASSRRDAGTYAGRVKTGIMLGLGERPDEVSEAIREIAAAGVEVLTIGQYMQPTRKHLPVARWVHPDEFAALRDEALAAGLTHCESGPLVRSSYHAHKHAPAATRVAGE
jgi:lipoic acid synthetase